MGAFAALRDGIRRVNAAPMVLGGMFALTLLVALPLSIALRGMIEAHLGDQFRSEGSEREILLRVPATPGLAGRLRH